MIVASEVDIITDTLKEAVISKLEIEQNDIKKPSGKLGIIVDLMLRPEGVIIQEMMDATSWQKHSVRGAISGQLKRRWGYTIDKSTNGNGETVYHIAN